MDLDLPYYAQGPADGPAPAAHTPEAKRVESLAEKSAEVR